VFVVPALRKMREGRGTLFIANAREFKSLGHPPIPGLFEPVFGELFCWFADCGLVDAFDCAVAFLDAVLAPPLLVDVPWETVWA